MLYVCCVFIHVHVMHQQRTGLSLSHQIPKYTMTGSMCYVKVPTCRVCQRPLCEHIAVDVSPGDSNMSMETCDICLYQMQNYLFKNNTGCVFCIKWTS